MTKANIDNILQGLSEARRLLSDMSLNHDSKELAEAYEAVSNAHFLIVDNASVIIDQYS